MRGEHLSVPATYARKKENEYTPGVLTMTEWNFTFTPNDSRFLSTHKIDVDIGNITVQYGTAKGKDTGKLMMGITVHGSTNKGKYILELDTVYGDSCRDFTNRYVGKEPHGTTIYPIEVERKITLLQHDLEQRRLHKELVTGNIIKEDEFWAKRKKLLQAVACAPTTQQTGIKSVMLSYIQLMSGDQTKNAQINSETIQQVFTEKPVVLREFLKKVPNQMKEPEFWSKFSTAESYRRKEKIALGRAEASVDRLLAIFLEDDDIVADEVQDKIKNVDPTIDMVADYSDDYTHLEGHGISRYGNDDDVVVVTDKLEEALLHDINRHAITVLEGRQVHAQDSKLHDTTEIAKALDKIRRAKKNNKIVDGQTEKYRIQKVNSMVEIDDLKIPHNLLYVPLTCKDPCQYSASQEVDVHVGHMDAHPENVYADIKELSLKIKNQGLKNPVIKSDLTLKVIDQCAYMKKSQIGNTPKANVLENLPQEISKNISQHLEIILELLWHFWASYPPTNEFLDNRINQLKGAITQIYEKLQEIMKSLQPDVRHQISLLVQPMLQAIGVATQG